MKPLKIAVPLVAAATLGAGAWWWVTKNQAAEMITSGVPERPVASLPAGLDSRLSNLENDVRSHHSLVALGELASLYHANGYFPQALKAYAVLMELEPAKPQWPHLAACILAGDGALEQAIPLFASASKLDPSYVPAAVRLGDCLIKVNRIDEARPAYETALKASPGNPYALQGMARIAMEKGDWADARLRLEQASTNSKGSVGYDLLVSVYEKLGLNRLALSLRAKNKASGAFYDIPDPWQDALFIACLDPYRATIASGAAARNGDMALAEKLLRHVMEVAPNYALAHYHLGIILSQQGKGSAALAAYERSATLDPGYSDTWVRLVQQYEQTGDTLGAEATLERGLKACPHSPRLTSWQAGVLTRRGRLAEAEKLHLKAIALRPDESWSYISLAKFLLSQDRVDEAVSVLHKGLEIEPEEPEILSILSFHAIMIGDETEARAWLQRVKEQPRSSPESTKALLQRFQARFGKSP